MIIVDGKYYLDQVKELIMEYTNGLNRDLSFQNVDAELNDLANKYMPPNGKIMVAVEEDDEMVVGMVAYTKHSNQRCEMKRLYVLPNYRNMKLGEQLVNAIIFHAKREGFREMVLDTIKPLKAAIHLYQKMGFEECKAYYDNPMDDVIYMKKEL